MITLCHRQQAASAAVSASMVGRSVCAAISSLAVDAVLSIRVNEAVATGNRNKSRLV